MQLPDPDQRDVIAYMFLKDFIKEGFPNTDPEKQILTAYYYADVMCAVRERRFIDKQKAEEKVPVCESCGGDLTHVDLSNLDGPGSMFVCTKCGKRNDISADKT